MAVGGRFVFVITQPDDGLRLLSQHLVEIVNRVAAQDDDCIWIGFAKISFGNFRCLAQRYCIANRAQRGIDRIRQQMNFQRLALAGHHQGIRAGGN